MSEALRPLRTVTRRPGLRGSAAGATPATTAVLPSDRAHLPLSRGLTHVLAGLSHGLAKRNEAGEEPDPKT